MNFNSFPRVLSMSSTTGAEAKARELRAGKNIYLQEKEVHHGVSLGNTHPLP